MRKLFSCILILVLSITLAQDKFQKGFFINNDGNKIECLIKNVDWMSNPNEFNYRLNENEPLQTGNISSVKEFQIYDQVYFKRILVSIDKSSSRVDELSQQSSPEFKKEVLFLKVLVEGKATLYSYEDGNMRRFFYEKDNNDKVEQLVYKQFIDNKSVTNSISENKTYQNQLYLNFKIENLTNSFYENIDYYKNDLIKYFIKYNESNNSEYKYFQIKRNGSLFHLNVRLGYKSSSVNFSNSTIGYNGLPSGFTIDFDTKSSFRLGVEGEFILPFNNDKWSIIAEPTYQSFDGIAYKNKGTNNERTYLIDYKSIELPIGLRYYFYISEKSRLFVNTSFVTDLNFKSSIKIVNSYGNGISTVDEFPIQSIGSLAFGLGYKYLDKYSLEVRTGTNRELLGNNGSYSSIYRNFSVILGYKLF